MAIPDDKQHDHAADESILPLDDGDVYVCQNGQRDAPALVLIHGSASSTHAWDALVPMLTTSHRVIRIDLLGHGRSAKPAGDRYQTPEQGRRVGMALERLGVTRAIVVGHSSGGFVATALAEQRPGLVTALALINTGPSPDALIAKGIDVEPSQWPRLTDEQIRQVMRPAFSRTGYQIPQQLVDDVRVMTFHAFTATMQANIDYLDQRSIPDRLVVLGKSLLVIFGADDRRWRSSSATDYYAITGAQVDLLPGIGHSPPLEDPRQTATSLLAFAAKVRGQATDTGATGATAANSSAQ